MYKWLFTAMGSSKLHTSTND
uniref:Uncharacterized protein n=1 Tax=Anguilla anguilla TaxID=7936 RepID=A0A0E9TAS4_ANGAN